MKQWTMDLYKEECYSFTMYYSIFLRLLPFQRTFVLHLHSNIAAVPCESIRFVSVLKLPHLHNMFLSTHTPVDYTQDCICNSGPLYFRELLELKRKLVVLKDPYFAP